VCSFSRSSSSSSSVHLCSSAAVHWSVSVLLGSVRAFPVELARLLPLEKNLCWICLLLVAARFSAFCFFFLFCSFILLDPVQDSYCAAIVFVSVFSPACVPPPSPSSLPYCLRYTAAFLGLRCM
jgi:hypothetical protein